MIAAMYGYEDIVRILAEKEAGMKDQQGCTALYYSSTKECAQFLWQFPKERDTRDLHEVKRKYDLGRLSCADGTCQGAVSLLTAAFIGCP